jgi:hypothetical protein
VTAMQCRCEAGSITCAPAGLCIVRVIGVIYSPVVEFDPQGITMVLKRGLLQILLAALLLVAQYAALTHGLRHWQPNPLVQSQQDEGGKQKSATGLCDFHVAFAEVLGVVGSCAISVTIAVNSHERSSILHAPTRTAQLLTPLSRGPPAHV